MPIIELPRICQQCPNRVNIPCRRCTNMFVPALDAKRVLLADMNRDAPLERDLAQEYLDEMQRILREAWTEFKHWIAILKDRWYRFRVRVEDWWDAAWKPSVGGIINVFAVIEISILILAFILFG